MTILYDARCEVCRRSRRISEALDWFRKLDWQPNKEAQGSIVALDGEQRLIFWSAVKAIALRLPITWLLIFPAIGLLPIFNPIGDRVYRWIAANRYRLSGNSCDIE